MDLSANDLPELLYIRTKGVFDGEVEGDLVFKFKAQADGEEIEVKKLKLVIVHRVGDKKYFNAASDYMKELNSKVCIRYENIGWTSRRGNDLEAGKQIVMMLHENTKMKAVETSRRAPKLWGISQVSGANANADVAVNGNYCFFSRLVRYPPPNGMTRRCHGVLVTGGVKNGASATGGNSPFESAQADFISSNGKGSINIQTGIVPTSPVIHQEALGGFASKLENYAWHPWYGIGETETLDEKVVFVALPKSETTAGAAAEFKQKLKDSGVPALPGGQAGEIQCIAGDGGSSLGLAYRLEGTPLEVRLKGGKHIKKRGLPGRGSYFINTYLIFETDKPR